MNAAPKTGDNDEISDFTEENADKPAENGVAAAESAKASAAQGSPAKVISLSQSLAQNIETAFNHS